MEIQTNGIKEELFTIGDDTNHGIIQSFKIIDDGSMYAQCSRGFFNLSELKKANQILFTTSDNVNIYEGDIYWTVEKDFNLLYSGAASKIFESGTNKSCKYFSTEQAANEYILYNKKGLSLNDLLSVWDEHAMFPKPQEHYKSAVLFKSFENLVKQKIKQLTK